MAYLLFVAQLDCFKRNLFFHDRYTSYTLMLQPSRGALRLDPVNISGGYCYIFLLKFEFETVSFSTKIVKISPNR